MALSIWGERCAMRITGVGVSDLAAVSTFENGACGAWTSPRNPLCFSYISRMCRCSASSSATWCICNRPLANASNAVTLLVITDAPIPKPKQIHHRCSRGLGRGSSASCRGHCVRGLGRCRAARTICRRLCSMNTTCAVLVVIEVAPRREIDTLAFFNAITSLMPSPTKQTLCPSRCNLST